MDEIFICKNPDEFIPGLELNRGFYFQVVKLILDKEFPKVRYLAALSAIVP